MTARAVASSSLEVASSCRAISTNRAATAPHEGAPSLPPPRQATAPTRTASTAARTIPAVFGPTGPRVKPARRVIHTADRPRLRCRGSRNHHHTTARSSHGSSRLARHIACGYGTTELPTLPQQPPCRSTHHKRIVRCADRPHEVLVLELLPVRERDAARERIDQPRAGQSVPIFAVLSPVVQARTTAHGASAS